MPCVLASHTHNTYTSTVHLPPPWMPSPMPSSTTTGSRPRPGSATHTLHSFANADSFDAKTNPEPIDGNRQYPVAQSDAWSSSRNLGTRRQRHGARLQWHWYRYRCWYRSSLWTGSTTTKRSCSPPLPRRRFRRTETIGIPAESRG